MCYNKLASMSFDFEKQFDVEVTDNTDINIKRQIEKLENDLASFNEKIELE